MGAYKSNISLPFTNTFLSRKDEMNIGKKSWAVGDADHG